MCKNCIVFETYFYIFYEKLTSPRAHPWGLNRRERCHKNSHCEGYFCWASFYVYFVLVYSKGNRARAKMPSGLRVKRIADLNRGVYNSIVMIYKVRGELAPLTGTVLLTVKDKLWDDSIDDSSAIFKIEGQVTLEEPWRAVFPISAEQSYLDPTKEYFGDITVLDEEGIPLRKAILSFEVCAAPTNIYSSNTNLDDSAGSTVCVNEGGCNTICVNVCTGERGKPGEKGDIGTFIEYNLSNQLDGVRKNFLIDQSITDETPVAVYYGGQRFVSGIDYVINTTGHELVTLGDPLDALEDRKLILVAGNDTGGSGMALTAEALMQYMDPDVFTIVGGKITLMNEYLPLTGGTMLGDVEFNGHRITNANINGVTNG